MGIFLSAIYWFLPAYVANMAPVIAAKLKLPLGTPISFKWLGEHKTWRGIYAAYIGALLILWLQWWLQGLGLMTKYTFLDYQSINLWGYAVLFGLGAIVGDALKSFIKRRLNKPPGTAWVPFDQLDFVVGAIVAVSPWFWPGWPVVIVLMLLSPILHLLVNVIGYWLGFKKVWW